VGISRASSPRSHCRLCSNAGAAQFAARALSLAVVTWGAAIVKETRRGGNRTLARFRSPAQVRPMRRRLPWETGRVERGASDDRSERECRHRPRAG
jgi:hypothetical protein